MTMNTNQVAIRTHSIGQCFACYATVRRGSEVLHTTDQRPFGMQHRAYDDAEEWADRHGYLTHRGASALAKARVEYSRTVDAAVRHPEPDGRRVLTSEHCSLAAAIQDFERNRGFKNLEAVTAECAHVRAMWAAVG